MAKKTAAKRPGSKTGAGRTKRSSNGPPRRRTSSSVSGFRAKVRMYRQGLGDCHLIRLPRADDPSRDFFIMIDCGIVLGTPEPKAKMEPVVKDIMATTKGKIDLLLATHEHWDHLSGFIQARDAFKGIEVGQVWLAWTEDPKDKLAQSLKREKGNALAALRLGASHLHLADGLGASGDLESVLEFFGAAKGASTADALKVVRGFNEKHIRYCRPKDTPVVLPELGGVRLFVLGPPPDEKLLKRTNPSKANHEGYGLALANFADQIEPMLRGNEGAPFDPIYAVPFEIAAETDFFKTRYWRAGKTGEGWRRIDGTWLDGSEELALQLDNMTNNTSLVLAIELSAGDVMMFVADAQVGNWLSWQNLSWSIDGQTITGRDLLKRTILYKVGHHGSHNATLREKGLDMMPNLQIALVPVDHAMAVKKRWGKMPLPEIIDELKKKTGNKVFQSAMPKKVPLPANVIETPLYFEVTF